MSRSVVLATALATALALVVLGGNSYAIAAAPPVPKPLDVLADPGPQPTFDPSDYVGYRRGSGNSTIVAKLPAIGPDGSPQTCLGENPLLYPDTAYTRWMLQKWARILDGRVLTEGVLYPAAPGTGITVPPELNQEVLSDETVIQHGTCDGGNVASFTNVPAGKYIFEAFTHMPPVGGSTPAQSAIVNTPIGLVPVQSGGGGGHLPGDHGPGPGYVFMTRREFDVKPAYQYLLARSNIFPVAHYGVAKW
jgi:hypothetical protein